MLTHLLDTNLVIDVICAAPSRPWPPSTATADAWLFPPSPWRNWSHGAESGNDPSRSLPVVEDFCSRLSVRTYGGRKPTDYSSICAALEKQGQPIGVNNRADCRPGPSPGEPGHQQFAIGVRGGCRG